MASLMGLRRRIKSAKNISQITKAMEMVYASKMRKAQDSALAARPFTEKLEQIMSSIKGGRGDTHPLMEERNVKNILIIVVSTDKGLCGALNVNLFKTITSWISSMDPKIGIKLVSVGKKARSSYGNRESELVAKFHALGETPSFEETRAIARLAIDTFTKGEADEVYLAYPKFISTLQSEPTTKKLIPLIPQLSEELVPAPYAFEPGASEILEELVPYQIEMSMYQTLIEARASEFSARMVAMKNASDNAHDLINNLTLDYNSSRQASVTSELLDATTARMALE